MDCLDHLLCFRCGWTLKIQQQTFAVEFFRNLRQLLGNQSGAVALTGEIVIENEHGLFREGSRKVGKPLAVWRKMTGHVGKISWKWIISGHF